MSSAASTRYDQRIGGIAAVGGGPADAQFHGLCARKVSRDVLKNPNLCFFRRARGGVGILDDGGQRGGRTSRTALRRPLNSCVSRRKVLALPSKCVRSSHSSALTIGRYFSPGPSLK
jgi:hypothetical protein